MTNTTDEATLTELADLDEIKAFIVRQGLGTLKQLLCTATILYEGWEMDNKGWIVELEDGRIIGLTTSHGSICLWDKEEAIQNLEHIEASAASLRKALAVW